MHWRLHSDLICSRKRKNQLGRFLLAINSPFHLQRVNLSVESQSQLNSGGSNVGIFSQAKHTQNLLMFCSFETHNYAGVIENYNEFNWYLFFSRDINVHGTKIQNIERKKYVESGRSDTFDDNFWSNRLVIISQPQFWQVWCIQKRIETSKTIDVHNIYMVIDVSHVGSEMR